MPLRTGTVRGPAMAVSCALRWRTKNGLLEFAGRSVDVWNNIRRRMQENSGSKMLPPRYLGGCASSDNS
jgi:hypothetical protein